MAAPAAKPVAPPAASAPAVKGAPAEVHLGAMDALKQAQAAGLKSTIMVSYAVRCPEVAPPKNDVQPLVARDKLAGLIIDIDGFLREDMGLAETVAVLGKPVLCNHMTPGRYTDMHVVPKPTNLSDASIETRDGEVIGVVLRFEKPVPVDLKALEAKYGPSKKGGAPLDSFEAGSDDLTISNAAFRAQLMLSHRDHKDPPTARQVHQMILRRTATLDLLPEGFHNEQDIVRLLGLSLAPRAPDLVQFGGTLGVYSPLADGRIAYGSALPVRNIDTASCQVVTRNGVKDVRTLTVTFKDAVPCTAEGLAKGLAALLKIPQPTIKTVSGQLGMEVKDAQNHPRGTLLLDFSGNALKTIHLERFDNP